MHLHGLSAPVSLSTPSTSFLVFMGGGLLLFPMSRALLFVFSFLFLHSTGLPLVGVLNITIHHTTPASSALGPTAHPKGGINLFRRGHSWDSRTTVQHLCSYRDVIPSCLSGEEGAVPFPPWVVTAQHRDAHGQESQVHPPPLCLVCPKLFPTPSRSHR